MSSNADEDVELLVEVRRRRAELRASMGILERALASAYPAAGAATWTARLRESISGLHDDFGEHVAITEGSDGLYDELARRSPRLTHAIELLTGEHREILRRLDELLTLADGGDLGHEPDVLQLRRKGMDLLVLLMRHRQRGADLVFEAYELDLGGET